MLAYAGFDHLALSSACDIISFSGEVKFISINDIHSIMLYVCVCAFWLVRVLRACARSSYGWAECKWSMNWWMDIFFPATSFGCSRTIRQRVDGGQRSYGYIIERPFILINIACGLRLINRFVSLVSNYYVFICAQRLHAMGQLFVDEDFVKSLNWHIYSMFVAVV